MNSFMQEQWPIYEGTHAMRAEFLDSLSDADLAFNPGGLSMTFGALWREMGEIEYSYLKSLKTFKQDFNRNTEAGMDTSVAKLNAWFQQMDGDMKATLEAFSDDDFKKTIDRGFTRSVDIQMQIYLQNYFLFFGKATIYLKVMNRPLSEKFQSWIG